MPFIQSPIDVSYGIVWRVQSDRVIQCSGWIHAAACSHRWHWRRAWVNQRIGTNWIFDHIGDLTPCTLSIGTHGACTKAPYRDQILCHIQLLLARYSQRCRDSGASGSSGSPGRFSADAYAPAINAPHCGEKYWVWQQKRYTLRAVDVTKLLMKWIKINELSCRCVGECLNYMKGVHTIMTLSKFVISSPLKVLMDNNVLVPVELNSFCHASCLLWHYRSEKWVFIMYIYPYYRSQGNLISRRKPRKNES